MMLLNSGVGEDSWESPWLQGDPTSPSWRRSVLGVQWKDWCWSWSWELTHLKRPWCWERLKAGGKGDDRGWDGWIASPTQQTWVWVSSWSWWWTGRPGVLQFMGSQSQTRLSYWTELNTFTLYHCLPQLPLSLPSQALQSCTLHEVSVIISLSLWGSGNQAAFSSLPTKQINHQVLIPTS